MIRARAAVGRLHVRIPRHARAFVRARTWIGDITIDGHVMSGPNARYEVLLEPRETMLVVMEVVVWGGWADVVVEYA